jgi:hypothetical protein
LSGENLVRNKDIYIYINLLRFYINDILKLMTLMKSRSSLRTDNNSSVETADFADDETVWPCKGRCARR